MNYEVFLNENYRFEVVDVRDNVDMSRFIGYTTSTWKKIVTSNQRNYNTLSSNIHGGSTFILTYPDNSIHVFNGGKGDYAPPGYTRVSRDLENLFRGWDGERVVQRCRLIPLSPLKIFNGQFGGSQGSFCVSRDSTQSRYIMGWTARVLPSSNSNYIYVLSAHGRGVKCRTQGSSVILTQNLCKEIFEGYTRIRLRSPGASMVLINETPMRLVDGVWTWEGDAITEDMMLSVVVGHDHWVSGVEILND
jgi:hypothetical protein